MTAWWSRRRKQCPPSPAPSGCDAARRAKHRAKAKLDAAKAQQPRVDAEAEAARLAQIQNHFADQITQALRRRGAA